ncbi:MAG: hypothetical protein HKN25_01260 [Pyrinomonadaceae bacterium]|nr:hypothetical protein [Pyrinomonadaceae bacterium]
MKLRLRENSIRLRLQVGEVAQLRETGSVSEKIRFSPAQALSYKIRIEESADEISSGIKNGEVFINVPGYLARPWLDTDQVGIAGVQVINEELSLKILIEKDFKCLTPRADEVDMFPNPKEVHA